MLNESRGTSYENLLKERGVSSESLHYVIAVLIPIEVTETNAGPNKGIFHTTKTLFIERFFNVFIFTNYSNSTNKLISAIKKNKTTCQK